MIQTLVTALKDKQLRTKILYTLMVILIFRIGAAIPVPFTDASQGIVSDVSSGNFMNYLSMMTGDAFNYGTLFAMSITPYINASIIIQLLTVAIKPLEKLAKEGETGRKKINAITRYLAIAIALLQSTAYFFYLKSYGHLTVNKSGVPFTGFSLVLQAICVIAILTAGSSVLIWLGEQINKKGVGNGISILLFAGIISRIPTTLTQIYQYFAHGGLYYAFAPIALISMILMVFFIVWMDNSERRIPVIYAKRVVGRKLYGGQNTHIPIKVNMSGVMSIIFASSILSLPPTIKMFFGDRIKDGTAAAKFFNLFNAEHWFYGLIYFILIIFFAYFYAMIQYNPIEMANNLRKNSGSIPGIRPGKPTSDYLIKVLNRIILIGALLISVVALYPIVFSQVTSLAKAPMNIALGGTSVLIIVGVAIETIRQLESQLIMRQYKGFLD